MDAIEVVAINVEQRQAVLLNGDVWPITNFLDRDGEECDAEFAVMAVAGEGFMWTWFKLNYYETAILQ